MNTRKPGKLALIFFAGCLSYFLSSCSLITIEGAADPLPKREVNARFLTHEYITYFSALVEEAADSIIVETSVVQVQINALRWKIHANNAIRTTAFQTSPNAALIDTWTFIAQMKDFFTTGHGREMFVPHQDWVTNACDSLEDTYSRLVRSVTTPQNYAKAGEFVEFYVPEHPLEDITFKRPSTNNAMRNFLELPDSAAISTVGDLPQVMSDFSSRFSLFGQHMPKAVNWNTELFVKESGLDSIDMQARMDSLAQLIDRISDVAERSPQIVDSALQNLSYHLRPVLREIDYQRVQTLDALSQERALISDVIVAERANIMEDLDKTVNSVVEKSWEQARKMIGMALVGLIVLAIVILGLPFGMGYIVGKTIGGRKKAGSSTS